MATNAESINGDDATRAADKSVRNGKAAAKKRKPNKSARRIKAAKKRKSKSKQQSETDAMPATARRVVGQKRPFPRNSLEESLKIVNEIKQHNAGRPWDTALVAKACGYSQKTSTFYYLTASARDYGLTDGTRENPTIGLTDLGRDIAYAPDPQTERAKKIEAFFNVASFKSLYDYYGKGVLPDKDYLSNTLISHVQLASEYHSDIIEHNTANCNYLNISQGLGEVSAHLKQTDKSLEIRVLGKAKFDKTLFIVMPFSEKGAIQRPTGFFDEVLRSLIAPAGEAAEFNVETARRDGSDIIQHTIINQLLQADLVVADLTDHNPNVLFELGIRLAEKKPVAIIKAEGTGPVFDVDNLMRVYSYSPNLWKSTIETDVEKLTGHISGAWNARNSGVSYMTILRTGQISATV